MLSCLWDDAYKRTLAANQKGRKEGNILFNDALNTFYLRLYGVGHMVKDHSDSERGNPLPKQKEHPMWQQRVSSLAISVVLYDAT